MKKLLRLFSQRRTCLWIEELETLQLLSGFTPTPAEQLMLEELNDARANPAAYGASIGVNLAGVAPSQPLAFNTQLILAARLHSFDMNTAGYFAHDSLSGMTPGQRITAAGFTWTSWGESIAAGTAFPGPADALAALITDTGIPDLGHRRQLLAIDAIYQPQNQVGVGIVQNGTGPLSNYYTIDTASAPNSTSYLTGVVMHDDNGNGHYDIGEGMGGVTISIAGVGSTTTFDSGGYSLPVGPGTYTVTASGGGLTAPIAKQVVVGTQNARVSFVSTLINYSGVITNLYQSALGRPAAAVEITGWLSYLQNGGTFSAVPSIIEHSPEAESRAINNWYMSYLGRNASPAELQPWVAAMEHGMTGEQVQSAILGSDEFYRHAGSLNPGQNGNASYVISVYSLLLNRAPSASDLTNWVSVIATLPRESVADILIASPEYRKDVISGYYSTILHRSTAPSQTEVNAWALSGLDLTDIQIAFESSAEFIQQG
jgi:hypothetical protein